MNKEELIVLAREVVDTAYDLGEIISIEKYGTGHINDTFLVLINKENKTEKYILQRINTNIFKDPVSLMENIEGITRHIRKKVEEKSGDVKREVLNIVRTKEDKSYFVINEMYFRMYDFIIDARTYDKVENIKDFEESAYVFGCFQNQLSDYDAISLHETIKNFHDTASRFEKFKEVLAKDVKDRAKDVEEEIKFFLDNEYLAHILCDMTKEGKLPYRVTHNDTKLNNIMIDDKERKAICIIDLDTVMPGLAINDFGDSIRFGANNALEDELDFKKATLNVELFEAYTKNFIKGCAGSLTENELDMLHMAAMVMTYECGMRFLTDYLDGDNYFKISREKHNLDRARTQINLVKDMQSKEELMKSIVNKYR